MYTLLFTPPEFMSTKLVRFISDEKRARLSSEEPIVTKHDQTIGTQDQNTRSRSSSVSPNAPTQVTSTQFAAKFNSPTRSEASLIATIFVT